jgi:hypothetical protein
MCKLQGLISRGIHGLPKVSLGPACSSTLTSAGDHPLWPFQGWLFERWATCGGLTTPFDTPCHTPLVNFFRFFLNFVSNPSSLGEAPVSLQLKKKDLISILEFCEESAALDAITIVWSDETVWWNCLMKPKLFDPFNESKKESWKWRLM